MNKSKKLGAMRRLELRGLSATAIQWLTSPLSVAKLKKWVESESVKMPPKIEYVVTHYNKKEDKEIKTLELDISVERLRAKISAHHIKTKSGYVVSSIRKINYPKGFRK
jgi:arsenate reductase-like glutaredoxin family protein